MIRFLLAFPCRTRRIPPHTILMMQVVVMISASLLKTRRWHFVLSQYSSAYRGWGCQPICLIKHSREIHHGCLIIWLFISLRLRCAWFIDGVSGMISPLLFFSLWFPRDIFTAPMILMRSTHLFWFHSILRFQTLLLLVYDISFVMTHYVISQMVRLVLTYFAFHFFHGAEYFFIFISSWLLIKVFLIFRDWSHFRDLILLYSIIFSMYR